MFIIFTNSLLHEIYRRQKFKLSLWILSVWRIRHFRMMDKYGATSPSLWPIPPAIAENLHMNPPRREIFQLGEKFQLVLPAIQQVYINDFFDPWFFLNLHFWCIFISHSSKHCIFSKLIFHGPWHIRTMRKFWTIFRFISRG